MEFYEVIKNRHTVREWSNKAVDVDKIKNIINAGLLAPTNNHLREWEFIVLHTDAEKEIGLQFVKEFVETTGKHFNMDGSTPRRNMYNYAVPRQLSMLKDAPYVIIPLIKANSNIFNGNAINTLNPFASIWCVIENMLLARTNEGLACSIRIPVGDENVKVCKALNIPSEYIMPAYIGIGYPTESPKKIDQHYYTADEKIHFGKW